jgi:hypothetical protein
MAPKKLDCSHSVKIPVLKWGPPPASCHRSRGASSYLASKNAGKGRSTGHPDRASGCFAYVGRTSPGQDGPAMYRYGSP